MINKVGWNDVKEHTPPSAKLQLYTVSGICILGYYNQFVSEFITHWAYMRPSPTKQAGALK